MKQNPTTGFGPNRQGPNANTAPAHPTSTAQGR